MTTCSEFLYIELGVYSIKTQVLVKQWKFWKKVLELSDEDPLGYVVELARRKKLKEIKHYENLITKYADVNEIKRKFEEEVKTTIKQKAEKGRSKYVTYLEVNPHLETPTVYEKINHHKDVSMISKLRVSSHNLKIEMGRRTATPRNERKCHCGDVEDEQHFLVSCNAYKIFNNKISDILGSNVFVQYIHELYERKNENHA